jgi:hypothetical protein
MSGARPLGRDPIIFPISGATPFSSISSESGICVQGRFKLVEGRRMTCGVGEALIVDSRGVFGAAKGI